MLSRGSLTRLHTDFSLVCHTHDTFERTDSDGEQMSGYQEAGGGEAVIIKAEPVLRGEGTLPCPGCGGGSVDL